MDLAKQHQINEGGADGEQDNGAAVKSAFPEELRRRYEVFLTLPPGEKMLPMRGVTSAHLGSLVKLKVLLPLCCFTRIHAVGQTAYQTVSAAI